MMGRPLEPWLLVCVVHACLCYRIDDQIYLRLDGPKNECFRMLNGTAQVGCQSRPTGNVGIVVYAESVERIEQLLHRLSPLTSMRFVVAIQLTALNAETIDKLQDERIDGVLLLNDLHKHRRMFSEDAVCPNQPYSLYDDTACSWNKHGALLEQGFRFIDWPKPIFLITNATEIHIIKHQCFDTFNVDRNHTYAPLCAARMKFFMNAAGTAPICLRRQEYFYGFSDTVMDMCDPLEDENVLAVLPAPSTAQVDPQSRLFVLATRMDSMSSLSEGAVGEVSSLTSVIATLAVAHAIGSHLDQFEAQASAQHSLLLFSFFHGESMGYIGSSRMAFDMLQARFPLQPDQRTANQPIATLALSNIDVFVEIQQLDGQGSAYSAHVDGESYAIHRHELVDSLLSAADQELRKWNRSVSLLDRGESARLPPSSLQTFLKHNRSIAGFVLTPFDEHYTYRAVNSFSDRGVFNETSAVQQEITACANALLATVLRYFYGEQSHSRYVVDDRFVHSMLDCFVVQSDWYSCDMFQRILRHVNSRPKSGAKSTYISAGSHLPSLIRLLVNALLVHSLGKQMANVTSETQCQDLNRAQQLYEYTWQADPWSNLSACYRTSSYTTPAKSPAFELKEHDLTTSPYSTWVESVWAEVDLTLFLVSTRYPSHDLVLLLAACVFSLLCVVVAEGCCLPINQPLQSDPL